MTRTKALAWTIGGICVALAAAAIVLSLGVPQSKDVQQWGSATIAGQLLFVLPVLAMPVVGGLIANRRPENPIGWLLLVSGLGWVLTAFHDAYLSYGQHVWHRDPPLSDWLSLVGWVLPAGLLMIFVLLLFPDGHLPSPRWRKVAWFSAIVIFLLAIVVDFSPASEDEPVKNIPTVLRGLVPIATKVENVILLFPICVLLAAASLFVRYRSAGPEERGKLKWIAFGGSVTAIYYTFIVGFSLTFDHPGSPLRPVAFFLQSLTFVGFAVIPVSIGFAILRYQLYDIDRIISRTVSYVLVTVVLAAIYVLVVLVPTSMASGRSAPQWLVAVGTLVVAALFSPVRRRLQRAVDHRFNRRRYDAVRTVEEFATRLRDEIDIDELGPALTSVVSRTMSPAHVTLWLPHGPVTSS